jgi:hypothetical protein
MSEYWITRISAWIRNAWFLIKKSEFSNTVDCFELVRLDIELGWLDFELIQLSNELGWLDFELMRLDIELRWFDTELCYRN